MPSGFQPVGQYAQLVGQILPTGCLAPNIGEWGELPPPTMHPRLWQPIAVTARLFKKALILGNTPKFFFSSFFVTQPNLRLSHVVYRLIVATIVGNFLDDPFLK